MLRTTHIHIPFSNAKMRALTKRVHGQGVGAVLLDGGIGGQSSYMSLDHMNETVNRPKVRGSGLADKLADKLNKLKLEKSDKPKRKNITMTF